MQAGGGPALLCLLAPGPKELAVRHKAMDLFLGEQGAKVGSWVGDDIMERCFRKGRPEGSEKKAGQRDPETIVMRTGLDKGCSGARAEKRIPVCNQRYRMENWWLVKHGEKRYQDGTEDSKVLHLGGG